MHKTAIENKDFNPTVYVFHAKSSTHRRQNNFDGQGVSTRIKVIIQKSHGKVRR